jgi:hypothetical protein
MTKRRIDFQGSWLRRPRGRAFPASDRSQHGPDAQGREGQGLAIHKDLIARSRPRPRANKRIPAGSCRSGLMNVGMELDGLMVPQTPPRRKPHRKMVRHATRVTPFPDIASA